MADACVAAKEGVEELPHDDIDGDDEISEMGADTVQFDADSIVKEKEPEADEVSDKE